MSVLKLNSTLLGTVVCKSPKQAACVLKMHFSGTEQDTKVVRPAPKSSSCKTIVIPRGKYPSTDPTKRKEWDSTPYVGDCGFNRRTVCKNIAMPVPTPDFKCIPVKQIKRLSNGDTQEREVLVCQENWKPAMWACGPQNYVQLRQCHKWGAGVSKITVTPLPNNYRILYCLGSDQTENEDASGHAAVCEISDGARGYEDVDEAHVPAGAGIPETCCCWRNLHCLQDCDCDTESSRQG